MFILYVLDAKHRYLSQPIGICDFKGLNIMFVVYLLEQSRKDVLRNNLLHHEGLGDHS